VSELILNEGAAAATPATNKVAVYAKTDGKLYFKDDAGLETSAAAGDTFKTIDCPSGTDPVADSSSDTLTLATDGNISVTGDSTADSVTFGLNTVPLTKGGTGQTTANASFNALVPSQTGNSGKFLTTNGTDTSWATSSGASDPLGTLSLVDDFPLVGATTGQIGSLGWLESTSGTAAATVLKSGISGHPGIITIRPGTVAAGRACISLGGSGTNTLVLGGGAVETTWIVRSAQTLSAFEMLIVGLGDTAATAGDQVNGVYFQLLTGDTNWFIVTANASTRTRVDTGIAYVANSWFKLKLTVNAAGTSVQANINGTNVGTAITTNIPTAAISPMAKVDGIASGTASDTDIDFFSLSHALTTTR
jgi:hypothetical protein